MKTTSVQDVLYHGLQDMYSAEQQFHTAFDTLSQSAKDSELKKVFTDHRTEAKNHISKLESCFTSLGRPAESEKCNAAAGIIQEGRKAMDRDSEPIPHDIYLATAGRKSQHYSIGSYQDCIQMAEQLGMDEVATNLRQIVKDDEAADKKLASISRRLMQKSSSARPVI